MFLRNDHGLDQAGGTATLPFGRAFVPMAEPGRLERLRDAIDRIDWAPDLGSQIGSLDWWRGAATCAALCAATCMLSPGLHSTILGDVPRALDGTSWDEARAQSIAPLAWGADTGRHMAANDLVVPLAESPERPRVELTSRFGQGDNLAHMLQRSGVSEGDATNAVKLISSAVALGDIKAGTPFDLTLGRRPTRDVPRPLEQIAFRARFDLALSLARVGGGLRLDRHPIAIDHTPLRIQGLVGRSLYRSARAAGAPAKLVEAYIKAVATHLSIGSVGQNATFDMVIDQARAATGEVELGALQFAGLNQGPKKTQLVKWSDGEWYEASGQTEKRGTFGMPVAGHITSSFGLRMHPILRTLRMHKGIDIGAPWGTPVHAAMDGIVSFAGRTGGYGNFIKLNSGGNIATGYGHLSRIMVRNGERVSRGQLIGAVGSTGLSTGPHLHWEVWKNGISVNPRSMSFSSVAQLSGEALRAFKAKFQSMMAVKPSGHQ